MIRLFMDSNEELWYTKAEELGYNIISMPYILNGELYEYFSGKDYDYKKFFSKVREGSMPSTCALNTQDYMNYFEPVFKAGDDIFYIHCSHKMTGSFEYMHIALAELKKTYPKRKFYEIDTLSISLGAGLLVYDVGKMFKSGKKIEDILDYANKYTQYYNVVFTVGDLNHLKRGGRIGSIQAFIGSLMSIKPILKITKEGKLEKFTQVNGRKKSLFTLFDLYAKNVQKIGEQPVAIAHADCEEDALFLKEKILQLHPNQEVWLQPVGPTVGTHSGPDAIAIAYYGNPR